MTSPAQAHERGCSEDYPRGGHSVEVFCDDGRPGNFRAVAHCRTALSSWDVSGSIGRVRGRSSVAVCEALVGPTWVEGYHVDWL
ncbi:hypothetical protein [Nocardia sp. NRRL S-836]|uniref:hypothetical protein n=1 Tax=Nocardia sp. NRRL S-836 TaxID=1519492 RepID=UPI0006AEF78F|nr:hypothetical protein [Nocardia sp. NRRL S-836]KOV81954.1 hypothetical protein ADL03_26520 [Nocardia sp. NRRL S-836]